jgi:hypothetical protein
MSFLRSFWRACALVGACVLLGAPPSGAVPALMNYQGHLSNGGGPQHGIFAMDFALYATPTGGAPLWSESYPSITVNAGVFSVLLGEATPLPMGSIFTGQTLWIETTVDGNVMSPRRPIVSVAYAARAAVADSALAAPAVVPAGAVVYTRWGRTACPDGATLVHSGRAAGAHNTHTGGGSNLLCLTPSPSWDTFSDANQNGALMYGAEYATSGYGVASLAGLHNFEVPCAVCLRENARVTLMIPGMQVCPVGWTLEYAGYLMANHYTLVKSEFLCVDRQAEAAGSSSANGGPLLYPTEGECGSLPCGPYVQDRELTCVVCVRP